MNEIGLPFGVLLLRKGHSINFSSILPRLKIAEVEIFRRGDEVVLRERSDGMARAFEPIANLPIDLDAMEKMRDGPPQERDGL